MEKLQPGTNRCEICRKVKDVEEQFTFIKLPHESFERIVCRPCARRANEEEYKRRKRR